MRDADEDFHQLSEDFPTTWVPIHTAYWEFESPTLTE